MDWHGMGRGPSKSARPGSRLRCFSTKSAKACKSGSRCCYALILSLMGTSGQDLCRQAPLRQRNSSRKISLHNFTLFHVKHLAPQQLGKPVSHRCGRRFPALCGPPIVPLPRKRLTVSAAGGVSPLSFTAGDAPHGSAAIQNALSRGSRRSRSVACSSPAHCKDP